MIRALLIDLDGTLISTLGGHVQAWREVLTRHGREFPPLLEPRVLASIERTLGSGGHSGLLPGGVLKRAGVDRATALRLVAEKRALYLKDAERMAEALPGMAGAVRALIVCGFTLAVQTTTQRALARRLLRACFGSSLAGRFAAVIGGDDVPRLKPAPDVLLRAAEVLAAPAGDCVVIGDSRADLLAADRAGMKMIAFHPGRRPPRWAGNAAASTAEAPALPLLAAFLRSGHPVGAWTGATLPGLARTKNRGFSATFAPPRAADESSGGGWRQRVYVKAYAEDPLVRSQAELAAMSAFRAAQDGREAGAMRIRVPEPLVTMVGYLVMRHERAVAANRSLGARLAASPQEAVGLLDPAVRCSLSALDRTPWPAGVERQPLFEEKFERYAVRRVTELAELWKWTQAARRQHEGAVSAAREMMGGQANATLPGNGPRLMHGDLKLDNLVVAAGELWLVDFEHARACTRADATFDLATVAADTMIRGALLPRRSWPQVAAVVRGWLEGTNDPLFGPCFLLACAIQGGTLRPGRRAYPAAGTHGPSHRTTFRCLMQAAFELVLEGGRPAQAVERYWHELIDGG